MRQLAERSRLPHCFLILACLVAAAPAAAQIPDEFKNLEVLPKDIGKRELVGMMREFSGALGQRCNFCHVGREDGSLEGMDFASDELEHKRAARAMMTMVHEINTKLLPSTGRESTRDVTCVTCHRGVKEPDSVERVVLAAFDDDGLAGAEKSYRELREEYYGKGSYDFSAGPLNGVAETLAMEKNDIPAAIELMKVNIELNPDEAYSHLLLGQLYAQSGDVDSAVASVEQAVALEPDNQWAKQMLERMKSAP